MRDFKFWVLALLIFLTLYKTGTHFVFGPEPTIDLRYFNFGAVPEFRAFGKEAGLFLEYKIEGLDFKGANSWKISNAPYDVMNYMNLVDGKPSIAPYTYRFFPLLIARLIHNVTDKTIAASFITMNFLFSIATALLFTYHLINHHGFSKYLALLGGTLFMTMIPLTTTLPIPMLEPVSFFFILLVFIALKTKNTILFLVSSILGVATKDMIVASSVLWLIHNYSGRKSLIKNIVIAFIPVVAFALIRISLGGGALDVNYGFDLAKGEFPTKYVARIFDHPYKSLVVPVVGSFSFVWLGLINLRKDEFLWKSSIIIPLNIMATILLSGAVVRVLGTMFPVIIPLFLLFFENPISSKNQLNTSIGSGDGY